MVSQAERKERSKKMPLVFDSCAASSVSRTGISGDSLLDPHQTCTGPR